MIDPVKRSVSADAELVAGAEPPPKPPEKEKDPAAVSLGRRGGLKGGRARVDNMTREQLSESARKAANARWSKAREEQGNKE